MFDGTMVVISAIIGAGIFINPYLVARLLPSPAWILFAWVLGGALAMIGALAYAELGDRLPLAGGQYVYLREAYHPLVGFLNGWALLLVISSGAIAAVAVTFANYLLALLSAPQALVKPVALAALAAAAVVNLIGLRPGRLVNNLLTVLKTLAIALLIAAGLVWQGAAPASLSPAAPQASLAALFAGLIPVLFSYGGWENLNYLAAEMRPQKPGARGELPSALAIGTAAVIAIYVSMNLVYLRVLGPAGLAATQTPAHATAERAFGSTGGALVAGAIVLSTMAYLNLAMLAPPRVYYAMAADGLFFRAAAAVHPAARVPRAAILIQAGWAAVLLLTGTYAELVNYVVFAAFIFFALTVGAVFVLRRRGPRAAGFRMPLYPFAPALFVAASLAVVISTFVRSPKSSALGLALVLTGIPIFYFWKRRTGHP